MPFLDLVWNKEFNFSYFAWSISRAAVFRSSPLRLGVRAATNELNRQVLYKGDFSIDLNLE